MKPFIALAASAPFLLLAGVGHAATFSFSDANCSSFSIDSNGVISCVSSSTTTPTSAPVCSVSAPATAVVGSAVTIAASCNPAATSYAWTASGGSTPSGASTVMTFATAGDYSYTVMGTNSVGQGGVSASKTITVSASSTTEPLPTTSCPTPPAGTVIVKVGGKDAYALKDFDVVFDNPGATFDSAVAAGESKALEFTNGKSLQGYLSATAGNYGSGYKDWSLSLCPGDFTNSLGDKCVLSKKSSINMGYSTDGSLGCKIPANQPVYLNVRGTSGIAAGWVMQNLQIIAQ